MIKSNPNKLVVVVTELSLKQNIHEILKEMGIFGFTVFEVGGSGDSGARDDDWFSSKNIRFEIACKEDIADKAIEQLMLKYSKNFAMFIYKHDIDVIV